MKHLRGLGFTNTTHGMRHPAGDDKAALRAMHRAQRSARLKAEESFLREKCSGLLPSFASGRDVTPHAIVPRIQLIKADTKEAHLFRLAALTWSVPVSRGYGRRMRFLVWDDNNGKLMGIMALGDPVFNLKARDDLIGWTASDRRERLVHVMDAYVLGALPPYNMLLGGKLIACLVRTREIRQHFARRYFNKQGIISGTIKRSSLVMVTTASALGRSSVYNRLKLNGLPYFEPIGYTSGWGHFHIPDELFGAMREYLEIRGHPYANSHSFGQGPNWRLRTIRAAVSMVGMDPGLLRHGISRQVFVCRLADNCDPILRGEQRRARYAGLLSVSEVGSFAVQRWIGPRAERRPEFGSWRREHILDLLRP